MIIELLNSEIRRDEGCNPNLYLDSLGVPTVGVGHNCLAYPLPIGYVFPLTDDQIEALLDHDLAVTFSGLDLHLPWWRGLDEVRQRVIANMGFNLGVPGLLKFHHMLDAVRSLDWPTAAAQMQNSIWYRQVGKRAVRLKQAMLTGIMPDEPETI